MEIKVVLEKEDEGEHVKSRLLNAEDGALKT